MSGESCPYWVQCFYKGLRGSKYRNQKEHDHSRLRDEVLKQDPRSERSHLKLLIGPHSSSGKGSPTSETNPRVTYLSWESLKALVRTEQWTPPGPS